MFHANSPHNGEQSLKVPDRYAVKGEPGKFLTRKFKI